MKQAIIYEEQRRVGEGLVNKVVVDVYNHDSQAGTPSQTLFDNPELAFDHAKQAIQTVDDELVIRGVNLINQS